MARKEAVDTRQPDRPPRLIKVNALPGATQILHLPSQPRKLKVEPTMTISPMLFICLFFAGFGVFLLGAAAIWWVSLQARSAGR
ncbi:hypothetical protein [Aestuariivita sp.]|jgi:hypothetical protein|uniref:hypothetical protein n=1 Tax=Aestuariivita sp. TaxID=1872407 RepID=UPI0021744E0B|nr:hypothetical protein [Aestuariivita sp.]MCE8009571.1 hypothetical protein [Aestuariivita sp.]